MDIQEIINYSKSKIESDDPAKQVRRRIKETAWEKQNQREGFSETFKPLISQFEKPEDPETKNIFTRNQEMLRNQLVLKIISWLLRKVLKIIRKLLLEVLNNLSDWRI